MLIKCKCINIIILHILWTKNQWLVNHKKSKETNFKPLSWNRWAMWYWPTLIIFITNVKIMACKFWNKTRKFLLIITFYYNIISINFILIKGNTVNYRFLNWFPNLRNISKSIPSIWLIFIYLGYIFKIVAFQKFLPRI